MEEEQAVKQVTDELAAQPKGSAPPIVSPKEGSGQQDKEQDVLKNVAHIEAQRLAAKQKDLEVIEARVDKKMAELKKFVENTEVSGRGFAGVVVSETDEEKKQKEQDEEIKRMLAGTGLSI